MEHTLNRLESLLAAPRTRFAPQLVSFGLLLLQNAAYGLAIGIGIAAGLALAG